MGTRGAGQMSVLVMGSVAQKVVHHATVPVTLVK
jgi:nucleotide-binding universal stress UspA family protein